MGEPLFDTRIDKIDYLALRMNQANTVLVDSNQQQLRIVWLSGLLDFEER